MKKVIENIIFFLCIGFFIVTLSIQQEHLDRQESEISKMQADLYKIKLENQKKEQELEVLKQIEGKEMIYYGKCTLTAYTLEECEKPITSGGYGITAIGKKTIVGITAAADWDNLPPGTQIFIEGLGIRIIEDRGGGIQGDEIDVYFGDPQEDSRARKEALIFGRQEREVWIINE